MMKKNSISELCRKVNTTCGESTITLSPCG